MLVVAAGAGLFIGLSLGALGGGGSILAVPVLVYLLGQSPTQATTGSLVVVGLTAAVGAVAAGRAGHVRLGQGLTFGLIAVGGAVGGARAAAIVPADVLMALFALLMLLVGALMVRRLRRHRESGRGQQPRLDDPIVAFDRGEGRFVCDCPRLAKLVVTATVVGLLTGFLGVGGGFVVVPALLLAFDLPMADAVGGRPPSLRHPAPGRLRRARPRRRDVHHRPGRPGGARRAAAHLSRANPSRQPTITPPPRHHHRVTTTASPPPPRHHR